MGYGEAGGFGVVVGHVVSGVAVSAGVFDHLMGVEVGGGEGFGGASGD